MDSYRKNVQRLFESESKFFCMVRRLICGVVICCIHTSYAQHVERYRDISYKDITIHKNVQYVVDLPAGVNKNFYRADVCQPFADHFQKRPLIIWLHGGAFKFGSKNAAGTTLWCETFAKRGYVCAAINYGLNRRNPLFKRKTFYKGCYEALQYVNQAIGFFKQNADRYGIDTNVIILAGNSAGAMIALQYAFSHSGELKRLIYPEHVNVDYSHHPSASIRAVINFWGAIFKDEWLKNAETPIVSVHGKRDHLVPIDNHNDFMSGSSIIHKEATSLGIPNRLKVYNNYAHELHKRFNPLRASKATKRRWLEAGQFAADFLYDELFSRFTFIEDKASEISRQITELKTQPWILKGGN